MRMHPAAQVATDIDFAYKMFANTTHMLSFLFKTMYLEEKTSTSCIAIQLYDQNVYT